MRQLIGRGLGRTSLGFDLERTAALWPDIKRAYGWVHRAAHILNNGDEENAGVVRRRFDGLVAAMHRHHGKVETLADAIGHLDLPHFPCCRCEVSLPHAAWIVVPGGDEHLRGP